uniref:Putative a kinase anchor protein n=1 Tax=Tabanus bromius TaxID=304241 RepID=A0A0K8TRY6_TABBR
MLPRHPIFYLSVPGVALVIGLAWLYHKKSCGDGNNPGREKKCKTREAKSVTLKNDNLNKVNTPSLNIANKISNDNESSGYSLGKSAPIDITNGKPSPIMLSDKQIDTEILKMKISNTELKSLRSIQEDNEITSPESLADSVIMDKTYFNHTISPIQIEEPVVIKATAVPKISPKDSFLESAYTEKCEIEEKPAIKEILAQDEAEVKSENANNNEEDAKKNSDENQNNEEDTKKASLCENNNSIIGTVNELQSQNECATDKTNENTVLENCTEENGNPNQNKTEGNIESAPHRISSPPLSLCSIQSGDSGKGSSPPHSECTPSTVYEFLLPNSLVGLLSGHKSSHIKDIKARTGIAITIKKHPMSNKIKICALKGNQNDINAALSLIRERLPEKRYPNLTLQRVHFATPQSIVPLSPQDKSCFQLELIEGINNDVVVSSIVSGGHIFVQQPLHPTYPSLHVMQTYLNQSYSIIDAPLLPTATIGAICVGKVGDYWYRVQIVNYNKDIQMCDVKFIDFGGYTSIAPESLRQISADFMTLPFQAVECLLSNIKPITDEWSYESICVLRQLTDGVVLQAQVAGYSLDNLPEIYLYACLSPNNVIFINQELVARRLARWIDDSELTA